ncbi:hypothetical protein EB001_15450 [bacterium]|nr:hypothetical protein [bacterium]
MAKITSTPLVTKYSKTIQIEFESPEEEAALFHLMNTLPISNLLFPRVDWYTFCAGIRAVTNRSGNATELEICKQLGANKYLVKE